jgi:hypothetical protein
LLPRARQIAELLTARDQTIAVKELFYQSRAQAIRKSLL